MLNHVCYVWLYYTWFFVFDCICAVLRGSLYMRIVCCENKRTIIIRPRRPRSAAACSDQTFQWMICWSVVSVGLSVCPVHCRKTVDRIRMPFGILSRTDTGIRQVVGFRHRSTERGTFEGEFGSRHCNQRGLYGVRVRQCLNRGSCGLGWCVRWAEALLY